MSKLKRQSSIILLVATLCLPSVALAAGLVEIIDGFTRVFGMLASLMIGVATLVFFWGLTKFVTQAGDEKTHDEGKKLMIWGMIAIFVMVSLWSIIGFFQEEIGLNSGGDLGELQLQPSDIP